jgi:hypothetical protein
MATTITLAAQITGGKPMRLRVTETPDQVQQAWTDASGQPFSLTSERDGNQVWLNPAAVVSWSESRGAPAATEAAGE